MLRCANGLEANKWNLHGAHESKYKEAGVGCVKSSTEAAHDEQHQHVQGDKIDDVDITSPGTHHVEVGERRQAAPEQTACLY